MTDRAGQPPSRDLAARLAVWAIRVLTPVSGEARAQWLVGRAYATMYLVRYYLTTQYAKASLGFLWIGIAPLLLIAVYLPVFLIVFKARLPGRDSPLDYTMFCLIGLLTWSTISDAVGQTASSLVANSGIVRHSPTPPAMLPIVKVLSSFVWLALGLGIMVFILRVTGYGTGSNLLLLPVAYGLLIVFMFGVGLLLSIVTAYVHDLIQVIPTILTIEFLAAPITYSPDMATGKMTLIVQLNPLTPFLTLIRAALLPWQPVRWADLGFATLWAFGALLLGGLVFKRLEGGLRDVV